MRATDSEYALAMKNADTAKVWLLENLFELQAEEIAIQTCLVMQPFLIFYQKTTKLVWLKLNQTSFVVYSLRFSLSFTFRYSFGDIPMYL